MALCSCVVHIAGEFNSLQLVDFGNAIRCVHEELSLYYDNFAFQTLLYRAPEVSIDIERHGGNADAIVNSRAQ